MLKLMKFHQNEKVRLASASVLSYRLPEDNLHMDLLLKLGREQLQIFDYTK